MQKMRLFYRVLGKNSCRYNVKVSGTPDYFSIIPVIFVVSNAIAFGRFI
jgi:hypothetical protein